MNFIQVKLFIVIHLFCVIGGTSYYCKIEDRLCFNNLRHVACHHHHHHYNQSSNEKNHDNNDNKYELLQQWNEIILSILDNFNTVRNHKARTSNIANMRLLTWHDEYQYLAEYSIKYPSHQSECYATEQFPFAQLYSLNGSVNSNDDIDLFNDLIKNIRRHTKIKIANGPDINPIYTDASIHSVGCGIGKLYDETPNSVAYLLRCIYNSDNSTTTTTTTTTTAQSTIEGTPCSRCNDYNTPCNIIYPALCGIIKFPTSAINMFSYQNPESNREKLDLHDSTKIDMILWFLGIILFVGLFVSCSIKLRKIFLRNNAEMGVVVSEKLYRERA